MTVAVADLVNDVIIEIPEIPVPLAILHMQKAIVEFFRRSEAYRGDYDGLTLVPKVKEYVLPVASTARIHKFLTVTADGVPLLPTSKKLLSKDDPQYTTREGTVTHYLPKGLNKLVVYPTPSKLVVRDFNIEVALTYRNSVQNIEDDHAELYQEALTHGALATLYAIEAKPWSNGNSANFHMGMFLKKAQEAKEEVSGDNLPKPRLMSYGGF